MYVEGEDGYTQGEGAPKDGYVQEGASNDGYSQGEGTPKDSQGEGAPKRGKKKKLFHEEIYYPLPEKAIEGKDPETVEELQHVNKILQTILKMKNIYQFYEKPNPESFGMWGYYKIIKEPMWFNEVQRKLEEGVYNGIVEFVKDLRLLLENCYRFWGAQHKITKKGLLIEHKLETQLQALPEKILKKVNNNLPDEDQVSHVKTEPVEELGSQENNEVSENKELIDEDSITSTTTPTSVVYYTNRGKQRTAAISFSQLGSEVDAVFDSDSSDWESSNNNKKKRKRGPTKKSLKDDLFKPQQAQHQPPSNETHNAINSHNEVKIKQEIMDFVVETKPSEEILKMYAKHYNVEKQNDSTSENHSAPAIKVVPLADDENNKKSDDVICISSNEDDVVITGINNNIKITSVHVPNSTKPMAQAVSLQQVKLLKQPHVQKQVLVPVQQMQQQQSQVVWTPTTPTKPITLRQRMVSPQSTLTRVMPQSPRGQQVPMQQQYYQSPQPQQQQQQQQAWQRSPPGNVEKKNDATAENHSAPTIKVVPLPDDEKNKKSDDVFCISLNEYDVVITGISNNIKITSVPVPNSTKPMAQVVPLQQVTLLKQPHVQKQVLVPVQQMQQQQSQVVWTPTTPTKPIPQWQRMVSPQCTLTRVMPQSPRGQQVPMQQQYYQSPVREQPRRVVMPSPMREQPIVMPRPLPVPGAQLQQQQAWQRSPRGNMQQVSPRQMRTPTPPRVRTPTTPRGGISPGRIQSPCQMTPRALFPLSPNRSQQQQQQMNAPPPTSPDTIKGMLTIGSDPDGTLRYRVKLSDGGTINLSKLEVEEIRRKNNGILPKKVNVPLVKRKL